MLTDTVGGALRERASVDPDSKFLRCGGPWLTARDVDAASDRIAGGLTSIGVRKGDRVAMILPNRIEFIETMFANAKVGAIHVALNFWLKGDFLQYQLADCGAQVLVTDRVGLDSARDLLPQTEVKKVVLVDDVEAPDSAVETIPYAELAACGVPAPEIQVAGSDTVSILYTSGTTGMPKGCMIPHGTYIRNTEPYRQARWIEPGDLLFTAYQLFHSSGQYISLMNALMGRSAICIEPEFHASTYMARAREERATALWGVGAMGMLILAQPPHPDDASHRFRLASWVPMAPADQERFAKRFNCEHVTAEGYGQTECTPITISVVGQQQHQLGAAGFPVSRLEVRLVDGDDQDAPPGTAGEIVIRPREPLAMFSGYWNKPEATLESFRNLWHHTGDYGVLNSDGSYAFVDRKTDSLRRRGENVSSFELEAALSKHPAIAQAAVHAVLSPMGEDDIKAVLVCHPDAARPEMSELFEFMRKSIPHYAIPRYVEFRDSLPLTPATGRVMKYRLREEGLTDATIDLESFHLSVKREDRRGVGA